MSTGEQVYKIAIHSALQDCWRTRPLKDFSDKELQEGLRESATRDEALAAYVIGYEVGTRKRVSRDEQSSNAPRRGGA